MNTLPERAGTVVIGGGLIGTSIACHLAETGENTVLLERSTLGSGSSAATAHVARTYFPGDPRTGSLAVRSLRAYHSFTARTATSLGLRRVGFLVLFDEEEQVRKFKADHDAQREAGVDVSLLTPAEALALNPLIDERSIVAAAWSPEAYDCDPSAVVRGYATAARAAGARVVTHTPVTAISSAGRVTTPAGDILAGTIVCAAGPWSREVASMAGIDLPVDTYPVELLLTGLPSTPVGALPMTLHATTGLRIRAWKDRVLVGMGRPRPGEGRTAWLTRVARQLGTLYPALDGIGLHRGWSGAFDATPDNTALIGAHHARPFLWAAGFSGQGLCQAPAAGEIIRDLVVNGRARQGGSALRTS
ncbi:NAD(P)/FAD-dependent oxidoreductase [Kitasatospora sp. NPDC090091]|uniref:NAD(P)/FAD-dependent oxidoreductase n=1 Tax=Kitasatospora sp. NPDC090091 TaxID=3364081 RepID=UPI00381138BA